MASSVTPVRSVPVCSAAAGTRSHSSRTCSSICSCSATAKRFAAAGRRGPGRAQRSLRLVRAAPVQRKPNLDHAVNVQRGVGFQRFGERPLGPGALAGQQVLPDGLPDQVMPERVTVGVGDHHVGVSRGPHRRPVPLIKPGHRGQQLIV